MREAGACAAALWTSTIPGPSPRWVHSTSIPVRAMALATSRMRSTLFAGVTDEALRIRRALCDTPPVGRPRSRTPSLRTTIFSARVGVAAGKVCSAIFGYGR